MKNRTSTITEVLRKLRKQGRDNAGSVGLLTNIPETVLCEVVTNALVVEKMKRYFL